jgi:hypothetical protein
MSAPSSYPFGDSAEMDLLQYLHQSDHDTFPVPYIWDPQSIETEAYLQALEDQWPEDIQADLENLAPTLNQVLGLTPLCSLSQLQEQFPTVPEAILTHILGRVNCTGLHLLSLREQLLYCIQDLFPRWTIEDLLVLARPYAYAFRSADPHTPPIDPKTADWETLEDFDCIRLCCAVAKVVLEMHAES